VLDVLQATGVLLSQVSSLPTDAFAAPLPATSWFDHLGQGWDQVGALLLAFVLSSLIGLERQLRGKSAGLRTQSIVGTTSALMLLVGTYGFQDVLSDSVRLDPSRVAAQIVSGVGFLGAGLILTRHGAVRGLTTAASIWETAAIGMASAAGLPTLALVVCGLHFVAIFAYAALARQLPGSRTIVARVRVEYVDGHGVLRDLIAACTDAGWTVTTLSQESVTEGEPARIRVVLGLSGKKSTRELVGVLSDVDGLLHAEPIDEEDTE
jgi:putative Mg2+ transporter-C (MgtC) family protein